MKPDRWKKVEDLYHSVRKLDEREREVVLQAACSGDEELRREVESLLNYEEQAKDFAESPVLEVVARDLAQTQVSSMLGSRFGPYTVVSLLGSGGMGDVYLAEDQSLDRRVALKFIQTGMEQDHTARERFLREAKSAASLEHPFICHVYEFGKAEETVYIVMEYVEGQTLQNRLLKGPVSLDGTLHIASEIAEALEAAHTHGIVHRDLKPSNIMLMSTGHVKVMDFGLAKRVASARAGSRESSTEELTKNGNILGTIAYMSPEQIRGEKLDARSDIFSYGVLLYEMLAGEHPFLKKSQLETAKAILADDPEPLLQSESHISEALWGLVGKTLAKEADQRYQSIQAVRADLGDLISTSSVSQSGVSVGRWSRSFSAGWLAVIVLAIALGVTATWLYLSRSGTAPPPPATEVHFRQVTFLGDIVPGRFGGAQISPDGSFLSYTAQDKNEISLWVQDLTGGRSLEISRGLRFYGVRWSPDSTRLLFTGVDSTGERIAALTPRLGGEIQALPWSPIVSWSPDGERFAGTYGNKSQIQIVDVASGKVEHKVELEGDYSFVTGLDWAPRDNLILVNTESRDQQHIWVVSTDGRPQRQVYASKTVRYARWSPSGQAIYFLGTDRFSTKPSDDLWKLTTTAGEDTAEPVRLIAGAEMSGPLSVSADGATLSYVRRRQWGHYWVGDLRDGEIENARRLTEGNQRRLYGSLAPGGEALAYSQFDPHREALNLFVMSISRGEARQITFMDCDAHHPAWSPDGEWIAFASDCGGKTQVWRVPAGGGAPKSFQNSEAGHELYWAPSREILYIRPENMNFSILDPETGEESLLIQDDSSGWVFDAQPSPDGMKVAVFWNRTDDKPDGIYVINRRDGTASLLAKVDANPRGWSANGNWIYASEFAGNLYSESSWIKVSVPDGSIEPLATPPEGSLLAGITDDAKRAVYLTVESLSDVWLVENFDPEAALSKGR